MINIKKLLIKEDRGTDSAPMGCLMAMFPKEINEKLNRFCERIIKENILYKEGNEFGREKEGHVTVRYGFTKDLNELEIRQLLKGNKPFLVELYGLDKFEGQPNKLTGEEQPYDVIFLKAKSPVLTELNEATKRFPHVDTYSSEYHPHATLAYVKRGTFPHVKKEGMNIKVLVNTMCYSPIVGGKSYYKLEG